MHRNELTYVAVTQKKNDQNNFKYNAYGGYYAMYSLNINVSCLCYSISSNMPSEY